MNPYIVIALANKLMLENPSLPIVHAIADAKERLAAKE